MKACNRFMERDFPQSDSLLLLTIFTCVWLLWLNPSIQTFWSLNNVLARVVLVFFFLEAAPCCQRNHIFLYQAPKQICIFPSDSLRDIYWSDLNLNWGGVRIARGQYWRLLTGTQEGKLKDRCSMFTSAWDRKSQLCYICAALPVTNSTIQPEIWNSHFHTWLMSSIA